MLRDGKYSDEVKDLLRKCVDWIKEKAGDHTITLIPLTSYSAKQAIKIIKKYSSMGVKYFCIDTLKADAGENDDNVWFKMQQSMVEIYNVVKENNRNVHLLATFQLSKAASKTRYYTLDAIGLSKNIVDVASTCIMVRNVLDDEYDGEKRALKVFRLEGKNGMSKIPEKLLWEKRSQNKTYQVVFITKNREGAANKYQMVIEHDLSRNTIKEVGITNVDVDF